jgi:hypothetical protein
VADETILSVQEAPVETAAIAMPKRRTLTSVLPILISFADATDVEARRQSPQSIQLRGGKLDDNNLRDGITNWHLQSPTRVVSELYVQLEVIGHDVITIYSPNISCISPNSS